MKTIREQMGKRPIEDTFDDIQQEVVQELQLWLIAHCKSLDEGWKSLKEMEKWGQFVLDYADHKALSFAFKTMLMRILRYGKAEERKITIQTGAELTFEEVRAQYDLWEIVSLVRSLICSALDGWKEEQESKHKGIAKVRVDLARKDLYRMIDEGQL